MLCKNLVRRLCNYFSNYSLNHSFDYEYFSFIVCSNDFNIPRPMAFNFYCSHHNYFTINYEIDMSGYSIKTDVCSNIDLTLPTYLNWLESGVNLKLDYYTLNINKEECDIFLENFNHLVLDYTSHGLSLCTSQNNDIIEINYSLTTSNEDEVYQFLERLILVLDSSSSFKRDGKYVKFYFFFHCYFPSSSSLKSYLDSLSLKYSNLFDYLYFIPFFD